MDVQERDALFGLFPYGKSGLKYCPELLAAGIVMSLPVWEEWIEMLYYPTIALSQRGLFPYGKSGLKFVDGLVYERWREVSSRMGRVD